MSIDSGSRSVSRGIPRRRRLSSEDRGLATSAIRLFCCRAETRSWWTRGTRKTRRGSPRKFARAGLSQRSEQPHPGHFGRTRWARSPRPRRASSSTAASSSCWTSGAWPPASGCATSSSAARSCCTSATSGASSSTRSCAPGATLCPSRRACANLSGRPSLLAPMWMNASLAQEPAGLSQAPWRRCSADRRQVPCAYCLHHADSDGLFVTWAAIARFSQCWPWRTLFATGCGCWEGTAAWWNLKLNGTNHLIFYDVFRFFAVQNYFDFIF